MASMASKMIETHKDSAEVYQGKDACNKKIQEILVSHGLPNGLLPVDITELGHDKASGFAWVRQEEKTEKKNVHINKIVSYDAEIAFFLEEKKVKKAVGIRTIEFIGWVTIAEIYIDEAVPEKIVFKTPQGFSRQLPCSAFVIDEQGKEGGVKDTN